MGGSFPGIFVPAANQLSVPQSGNWCGPVTGFADANKHPTALAGRVRVSRTR